MSMIIDGTNGLTFNNATTQASGGKVIQVVSSTYSTQVQNNTSTYTDTGLTASITPLFSTSKILVLINQNGVVRLAGDNYAQVYLQLQRNGGSIFQILTAWSYNGGSGFYPTASASACYLDSPTTTSSTTYKTQFLQGSNSNGAQVQSGGCASSITLLEIAA